MISETMLAIALAGVCLTVIAGLLVWDAHTRYKYHQQAKAMRWATAHYAEQFAAARVLAERRTEEQAARIEVLMKRIEDIEPFRAWAVQTRREFPLLCEVVDRRQMTDDEIVETLEVDKTELAATIRRPPSILLGA